MSRDIKTAGMVLQVFPVRDNDRRIILLTRDLGKITVFARGARKPGSSLGGKCLPFCFGTFTLIEGRTAYTLVSADIDNYFSSLRTDLEGAGYGFYFMELASYYSQENLESSVMLNLLYVSLRALENDSIPDALVRYVCEIRMMVINGEYPQDQVLGGEMADGTRAALEHIIRSPLRSLYSFVVTPQILSQIASIQDQVRRKVIDAKFKTLEVLESMAGFQVKAE